MIIWLNSKNILFRYVFNILCFRLKLSLFSYTELLRQESRTLIVSEDTITQLGKLSNTRLTVKS